MGTVFVTFFCSPFRFLAFWQPQARVMKFSVPVEVALRTARAKNALLVHIRTNLAKKIVENVHRELSHRSGASCSAACA